MRSRAAAASGAGKRACASHGALCLANHETIEIPAIGFQAADFHVDGIRQRGRCNRLAARSDAGEMVVVRHLPAHGDRILRQVRPKERCRRKSRPQYDGVLRWRAAGDA